MKALLSIFSEFFRISLFVLGGGYSILVVADRRFAKLGWTEDGEILDRLPVFQTIPGLIATHTAVYVGRKRAGALGAFVAVVGVAVPAVTIFTAATVCYRLIPLDNPWLDSAFVGLRAALTGVILATIVQSWRKSLPDAFAYAVMLAGVLAIGWFHIHVALFLVLAMLFGLSVPSPSTSPAASTSRFNSVSFLPLLLFAQYGALCFGGGFVLVPMYLHDFIGPTAPYLQIADGEFGDIMALSQMTPGPIGVNCATFFGYRLAGVPGSLIASAMLLLPGSVLAYAALSSLDRFKASRVVRGIMRGIRPASIALMLVAMAAFMKMTVFCDDVFRPWGLILMIAVTALTLSRRVDVILLIVISALTASALRADVTAREYPDADTVVLDRREEVEYFPDGTFRSVEERWTKALTEKGRRQLGTEELGFSRRYGTARFAEVAIISPDGAKRTLELDGLVSESTDNSATVANIYDPLDRLVVCGIPGVKVGDTVYVREERSAFAARCQDQWADTAVFEGFSPILRASFRVKCPPERPLRSIAVRNPLGNLVSSVETNADGSVVMEWRVTDSPQAFREPSMPTPYRQLQHVCVSTAADWRELSKWYWRLCAPHLAKTNAAMIAKIGELKSGVGGREALLKGIFRFVSQEIRYMGLTMEDKSPGYAPHDVDLTFDRRYGVCRDKAVLLAAMLRIAGFDAYPVLIMAGSAKMDRDVPSPYFNHAIVAVDVSEDEVLRDSPLVIPRSSFSPYILMDPTAESTRDLLPSYESDCSYLVARPEGEMLLTTPMPPADDNLLKIDSSARLSEDGSMLLESEIRFTGLNDNVFRQRLLRMKPAERRRFFESVLIGAYPGAKLLKLEIRPERLQDVAVPLSAAFSATVPEAWLRGSTEIRLVTGWLSSRLGIANLLLSGKTALEKRRFPLRLPSTAGVEETLTVAKAEFLGPPKSLPEPLTITGPYAYSSAASVTPDGYAFSRRLKVDSLEFSPEEYLTLRERIKSVEASERRSPVFEVDRFAGADVHYPLRGMSVDFTGVNSWVETNTVVKRILTYDGKKRNSEIGFDYNPLIEKVKVLRASVTGADGGTVFVGEEESNAFDCDWAASAPRYPASRKLVVTLPAVGIGSVITTVVETVVTDAPTAFRARCYIDVTEPTDQLVYRFGGEVRRVFDPERIPDEDAQPAARCWRRHFTVDRGTSAATCAFLRRAAAVEPLDPSVLQLRLQSATAVKAIRDWMAKHVRVCGPSLYELPLDRQLTDPAVVVKERYATRLDYVRALCALLKGAGFGAEVVFASSLRGDDERYPAAYTEALCRTDGMFIGTENEYSPPGSSDFDGCWYLDPVAEKESVVSAAPCFRERIKEVRDFTVRPNGAVDCDCEWRYFGQIGGWRRYFAEILPEMRSRVFQRYLGDIAQSASATSELVTDVSGYPGVTRFSCYVPDFATVEGDSLSFEIPAFDLGYRLTGGVRKSPIGIAAAADGVVRQTVVFPEGYTEFENLPKSFVVHNPADPEEVWCEVKVSSETADGRIKVTVEQTVRRHEACVVPVEYFPLLVEWQRRATSPSARTVTVRR